MRTIKKKVTVKICQVLAYNRETKEEEVVKVKIIGNLEKVNIPDKYALLEPVEVLETKELTYTLSPEKFFEVAEIEEA